jgi:hypothetical protein
LYRLRGERFPPSPCDGDFSLGIDLEPPHPDPRAPFQICCIVDDRLRWYDPLAVQSGIGRAGIQLAGHLADTVDVQHDSGPFIWELIDLLHIQIACIQHGILVRGATTIGQMHLGLQFEGPIFGPALVEAYEMEDKEVVYPRIVIMDEALDQHRHDRSLWNHGHTYEMESPHVEKLLKRDGAGPHYIDYLRASFDEFDDPNIDWPNFLNQHKKLIERELAESPPPPVRRKLRWLKNHHNEVVNEALERIDPEFFDVDFEMLAVDVYTDLKIVDAAQASRRGK